MSFHEYTTNRVYFLAKQADYFKKVQESYPGYRNSFRQVFYPHALDDAGTVCASMIKSVNGNQSTDLEPLTNRYMDYCSNKR